MYCSMLGRVAPAWWRDGSVRTRTSGPVRSLLAILGSLVSVPAVVPAPAGAATAGPAQAVPTTTTVVATAERPTHRETIVLTATVAGPAESAAVPAGAVRFSVDGGDVGGSNLDADGKGTIEFLSLPAGEHVVRAVYASPGDFGPSEGETHVEIGKAQSTTILDVVLATSVAGEQLEVSVAVRSNATHGGTPTGTIELSEPGVGPIGDPEPLNGDGPLRVSVVGPVGHHRIRATYSGDANFVGSTMEVPQETRKADTITQITRSRNPNAPGETFEVTVLVDVVTPGDVLPFGTLQLDVNGSPLGDPIPLDGAFGVRVTLQSSGGPRTDTIGVRYSGDEETNPSSASLRQTVAQPDASAAPLDPAAPVGSIAPVGPATPVGPLAPAGPVAPGSPTAPAGAAPRSGPIVVTSVAVSDLHEMTTGLLTALRRRGLRALRSGVQRLRAPEAGVLSQRVSFTPAAKRRARDVLVATGRRPFETAGTAALRLRVTAAERRHARRGRAEPSRS